MPAQVRGGTGTNAMRIAIYDLDRTITRAPTFTPFLIFAARHSAPWRLALLPVWVVLMIGYRLGLYDRTSLKTWGMRLLLAKLPAERLEELGGAFAVRRMAADGINPGALQLIEEDRAAGARIVIATAAFEFYAAAFAGKLGIEDVVGTRWDGRSIPGGNCYGGIKLNRVAAWASAQGIALEQAQVRFVSDSFADAPLLDRADEAIFVTASRREGEKARARGWDVRDLSC